MANPFLMEDDLPPSNEIYSNPFLMEDLDDDGGDLQNDYAIDNPFAPQVAPSNATNPFAAFGDEPDEVHADVPITSASDFFGTDTHSNVTNTDFFTNSTVDNSLNDINQPTHFFDTTIVEDEPVHHKPNDLNIKNPNTVAVFDDSGAYSSEDELKFKRKPPPPRPNPPPSKATQDLIMSVANELDQTSSHLLDRLPKTRTPSPVSMRDLHSPSPTPDFVDFLDVTDDVGMSNQNIEQNDFFSNNDDLMGSNPSPIMNNSPFGNIIQPQNTQPQVPQQPPQRPQLPPPISFKEDMNKNQPPRPPPPRPAPPSKPSPVSHFPPPIPQHPQRPPPPAVVPAVVPAHPPQQQQEPDLFDMFGTAPPARPPKPPAPKTKEDILSLYSVASSNTINIINSESNKMPDLLSGDILDDAIPIDNAPKPDDRSVNPMLQHDAINEPEIQKKMVQHIEKVQVKPEPEIIEIIQPPTKLTPPEELANMAVVEEIIEPIENNNTLEPNNIPDLIPDSDPLCPSPSTVFNMVITCEPDNPPSDEEDPIDYNPTPSIQKPVEPKPPEPTVETPIDEIPENGIEITNDTDPLESTTDFDGVASNPFGSPQHDDDMIEPIHDPAPCYQPPPTPATGIDFTEAQTAPMDIFSNPEPEPMITQLSYPVDDAFDAFSAKFDSADNKQKPNTNVFLEDIPSTATDGFSSTGAVVDAWGDSAADGFGDVAVGGGDGFGADEGFDSFLAMEAPPPQENTFDRDDSKDSDEAKEFNVFIRPKEDLTLGGVTPVLAPPPKSSQNNSMYSGDSSPRFNPFDKGFEDGSSADGIPAEKKVAIERTDSQESPATPLFDDDVSQPLEDFPRILYEGDGWEMQLRQPNKKRITAQRFWKKIHLKLALQGDNPVLQLYIGPNDKEPFQELPLQACYSVSDISAQQYDQFGKIFTVKLQYIFYKERPGVRPGQVTKAERLTSKLSQFAAYAIQGDYQGVKEFGSDLKKLGIPVEHAPQVSELFKLGSLSYEDMKQFSVCIEEALFKLVVHRDRALNYKTEEVQITAVDELYVEQDAEGHVLKQIARVRLFFLGFLSGMPFIELGVNDLWRQGKEVVGRHDIIPVVTEEWIRLEGVEFHTCVHQNEYEKTRTIRFQPPDACYIELMRFRIRPPKNRELPLQLKATWCVTGNKVELRADILVPGFASRKLGQIPCEDVMIRFPIPECWIYLFRTEKHFRYGSVKSAHRRTGKVKGIERILGAVEQLQESLIEVTSGSAKYEHQHRALVWRCPRLPKEGQGAYTTHQLVCRLALTSYDQIPEQLAPYCFVEFTMPATQASHTTVRSVSIQDSDSDEPPEKYVRYLARHEYRVGIEHTTSESTNPYLAATMAKQPIREEPAPAAKSVSPTPVAPPSDSDSDSN